MKNRNSTCKKLEILIVKPKKSSRQMQNTNILSGVEEQAGEC